MVWVDTRGGEGESHCHAGDSGLFRWTLDSVKPNSALLEALSSRQISDCARTAAAPERSEMGTTAVAVIFASTSLGLLTFSPLSPALFKLEQMTEDHPGSYSFIRRDHTEEADSSLQTCFIAGPYRFAWDWCSSARCTSRRSLAIVQWWTHRRTIWPPDYLLPPIQPLIKPVLPLSRLL